MNAKFDNQRVDADALRSPTAEGVHSQLADIEAVIQAEADELAAAPSASCPNDVILPGPLELAAVDALANEILGGQYRDLARRIADAARRGRSSKVLLIGAEHQPHVTDTAVRIAMAMAEGRQSEVLLLDGDFADMALSTGMNASSEAGLSEVIKGRLAWQQAVRPTATPGVCLLPAGRTAAPSTSEVDACVGDVLTEMAGRWDAVLIDGGSMNEPSARALYTVASSVYVVIRLGETLSAAIKSAIGRLHDARARLRGCIVTNG